MIFIYSTFPKKSEVQRVGEGLVKNRLAACVNIFPIDSIYQWPATAGKNKKIVKDKEFAMIIKTKKENYKKVEKFILEHHSYDTPCIIEVPLGRVNEKYLNWTHGN